MGETKTGRESKFVHLKPGKSNFETDNEKIFNITELAMLRVMTMMTGELDATDLLLNFSDFNFRSGLKYNSNSGNYVPSGPVFHFIYPKSIFKQDR